MWVLSLWLLCGLRDSACAVVIYCCVTNFSSLTSKLTGVVWKQFCGDSFGQFFLVLSWAHQEGAGLLVISGLPADFQSSFTPATWAPQAILLWKYRPRQWKSWRIEEAQPRAWSRVFINFFASLSIKNVLKPCPSQRILKFHMLMSGVSYIGGLWTWWAICKKWSVNSKETFQEAKPEKENLSEVLGTAFWEIQIQVTLSVPGKD